MLSSRRHDNEPIGSMDVETVPTVRAAVSFPG
jgi:hypothetical protein